MKVRYWCISTSPKTWEVCKEYNIWGMDARYYVTLDKHVRPGDRAVVYTQAGRFKAAIEFTERYYYSEDDLGWPEGKHRFLFPYRIKFRVIHESDEPLVISPSTDDSSGQAKWSNPNFIDNILFIADKGKTWNRYTQLSIISITEEDYEEITTALMQR